MFGILKERDILLVIIVKDQYHHFVNPNMYIYENLGSILVIEVEEK